MRLMIGVGKPGYAALLPERAALVFRGFHGLWQELLPTFRSFTRRRNACQQSIGEYLLPPNQLKFKLALLA
jgi:hypothetical protein